MSDATEAPDQDTIDAAFEAGMAQACRNLLRACLHNLPEARAANGKEWSSERADVVAMLRRVCDEWGDNDWPDELHVGDVIEKHLWRWLGEGE